MAKVIDSTNLGYLISKIKAAFWGKSETTQVSIDSAPTSASTNLVTSGGVYTALRGNYRLVSSGTISEDTKEISITQDSQGNAFALSEVLVFAKVRGNSAGYTGWVKLGLFCNGVEQKSGAFFQQFAAVAGTDNYYTILPHFKRVMNYCVPLEFWRSANNASVKDSLCYNTGIYVVESLVEVSGAINKIVLGGYLNGGIGAGTTYEIYGLDA